MCNFEKQRKREAIPREEEKRRKELFKGKWINSDTKLETKVDEGPETLHTWSVLLGRRGEAWLTSLGLKTNLVWMIILLCVDWEPSIPKETSVSWSVK